MVFLLYVFYFATLILLQGHQSEGRGPVCLQCDQVAQPSDCKNVRQCGDQELCIMQKYITNDGNVWFDVGCSGTQHCSPITSILGKRDYDEGVLPIASSTLKRNAIQNSISSDVRSVGDTVVCEKCCFGDICNAGSMCGTVGFLHEMICFNCITTMTTNEERCNTIKLCDKDQKCFIEKVVNGSTSSITWKTGCRHQDECQQLQSSPGTKCLSSCCSSDLCNMKCYNNYTACVDKSHTCTNKTFESFVCSQTQLQDACPRSCGLCHCASNPCIHGTCTSSRQGYNCSCDPGYTGSSCDRGKYCAFKTTM
ncbi:delta and Notch-like epidermal growth factor-related receptor [Mytilus edulis]|uniref:delta and Notch-like epidermal growth factor-related receptor n=1 Tax=Mytilus edulis TaxID=6550 RepID=UPI0039EEBEEC